MKVIMFSFEVANEILLTNVWSLSILNVIPRDDIQDVEREEV